MRHAYDGGTFGHIQFHRFTGLANPGLPHTFPLGNDVVSCGFADQLIFAVFRDLNDALHHENLFSGDKIHLMLFYRNRFSGNQHHTILRRKTAADFGKIPRLITMKIAVRENFSADLHHISNSALF